MDEGKVAKVFLSLAYKKTAKKSRYAVKVLVSWNVTISFFLAFFFSSSQAAKFGKYSPLKDISQE